MKTLTRSLPLALVALVWMGCEQTQQQPGMQEQPGMQDEQQVGAADDQQQQQMQDAVAIANMQGQPGSEQLQGSIVFTERNGQTTLTAALTGLQEGQHKIYVHQGTSCDSPGPVLTQGQMQGELGDLRANNRGEVRDPEMNLPSGLQFQGSNSLIGKVVAVYRQDGNGSMMPGGEGAQQQPMGQEPPAANGQAADSPQGQAGQETAGVQPEGQMVACGVIMRPDGTADAGGVQGDGAAAAGTR